MFIFSGKISDEPETTTFFGDKFEFPTLSKTILTARQQLENEAHKISVKAKTTLKRIKEFTNSSKPDGKCQSASDCKTNQVCYLPTNECKDQLAFSLRERTDCTNSTDCNENELCYLPEKVRTY